MEGLSSICSGLGTLEEDDNFKPIGYSKGKYCLDNLKDLLRFLRRDDPEKRDVFKQVCKWNIAGKDLIPIIEFCQEDHNLVLNAVKVLVFLTMPVEPASGNIAQQIEYLWGLKSAITLSNNAVPVILSLLETPLENLENESFTEDDWKLVQLVLTFFRNTLAIQDISTQQKLGGSATKFLSLRDRFLKLLFKENVMDVILVLSQHAAGPHGYLRQDNLLLLETFVYIFKGQEPELIAKTLLKGSKVDEGAENSVDGLCYIMEEEREKAKLKRLYNLNCYSQFSGTFTRLTLDGFKAPFQGNPCSSADALVKANKTPRGPSKRTMWDHEELPATNNEILKLLYDFTSQFLAGGYNVLMRSVREDIDKDHQEIENCDVVHFFQVVRFVTSFQYHKFLILKHSIDDDEAPVTTHDGNTLFKGNMCGPIAETLNESMFQLVFLKWRFAFDGLKVTNDYKFLSAAGSLLKTLIHMLDLVIKQSPEDSQELQIARILLYKLFYDQTEEGMTQFLLNLIKSFDTHKQSKSDLADLVEIIHKVLRLMENLQARGTLRVSKKSRKRRMKPATDNKNDNAGEPSIDNPTSQNEVGGSICEESVDPNLPNRGNLPNSDCNGQTDTMNCDLIDESITSGSKPLNDGSNESEMEGTNRKDTNDGLYLGTDDSSGDEQPASVDEVDFNVSSLVSAFANNTIIRNLCWLLKFYKSNSISTNHYIISMLRRVCNDLELSPMLYQLSYLTIFYSILDEEKSMPGKEYENVVTFLTTLIKQMLRKLKSNPFLFVEVLFWKTRKECHYINCGYMLHELNGLRNENGKGRNVAPNGESGFFEGKGWVGRSIADALGDDDFVIPSHVYNTDEDLYVAKYQKATSVGEGKHGNENSDVAGDSRDGESERVSKRRRPLVLNDELEGKLKDLYERYKDSQQCCHLIAGELAQTGAISHIQVSKALKQLGFRVPRKKNTQHSRPSDQLRDSDSELQKDESQPNVTVLEDSSSSRKPLHSRKRVRAFSEDQEHKIKDLYEQFKDHKRSSYLIASALDSTGTISAAKVSRKLKQLGLLVPKRKRLDSNFHLRDEDHISSEGSGNSDDETLLSMTRRAKNQRNGINYDERNNQKIASTSSEGIIDDELLSTILVKTRKMSQKSYDNSERQDTQVLETDDFAHFNQMETEEINNLMANPSSKAEPEVLGANSVKQSDAISIEKDGLSQEPQLDDLADSDEPQLDDLADSDADHDTTQESAPSRRRLRMVIDLEDDE